MLRSTRGELIPADPEIERTFHQLQREARIAQQQHMANERHNPVIPANEEEAVDEGNMLVGDFMIPQIIQSQSSIVYPPFGQQNFQLKTNIIHLFQNGHQFYGRAEETRIHTSLDSWRCANTSNIRVSQMTPSV